MCPFKEFENLSSATEKPWWQPTWARLIAFFTMLIMAVCFTVLFKLQTQTISCVFFTKRAGEEYEREFKKIKREFEKRKAAEKVTANNIK